MTPNDFSVDDLESLEYAKMVIKNLFAQIEVLTLELQRLRDQNEILVKTQNQTVDQTKQFEDEKFAFEQGWFNFGDPEAFKRFTQQEKNL